MRKLESYIIYLTLYAIWYQRAPLVEWALYALAAVTLLHFIVEKPRWQFTIVYLQVAHVLYSTLFSATAAADWPAGFLFILFSSALLIFSSAIACLFPVALFPALVGRYQTIGVEHRYLDTSLAASQQPLRKKRHAGVDLSEHPQLGLHVYYPSSLAAPSASKKGGEFLSSEITAGLSEFLQLPKFLFAPISLARTRAIPNASFVSGAAPSVNAGTDDVSKASASAAAAGKFPVIVLSHGLGGVANMYASQASALASEGYIVFGVTHNDASACLSVLPNGRRIKYKKMETWGKNLTKEMELERQDQLRLRAQEIEFVIDYLFHVEGESKSGEWSSPAPPYAGKLDLSRLALVGHSFGAATVILAANHDDRVKAVVTHDLWMHPLKLPNPVLVEPHTRSPLLVTLSTEWYGDKNTFLENKGQLKTLLADSQAKNENDVLLVGIPGTRHSNYSDIPMFSQLMSRKMGAIGTSDFRSAMSLINATQVAFLNKQLNGAKDKYEDMFQNSKKRPFFLFADGDTNKPVADYAQAVSNKQ